MELDLSVQPGHPDFSDLPWSLNLGAWVSVCARLEAVPHGPSRHPVIFVNYDGVVYALKEMAAQSGEHEYRNLSTIEQLRLPAVHPVGYAKIKDSYRHWSVLITRYLDYSIPFRTLLIGSHLHRYREHLLDAIAGLLVQLHLADVYWGDCSLSNALFRRDAGALRAYLVDAETAEITSNKIQPALRHQDLTIMEENILGELADLDADGYINGKVPHSDVGAYIRLRYQQLWEEITRQDIIVPNEHYRIQERIRALNNLGFSVGEVELIKTMDGNQLRLQIDVTDRNYHRDQLMNLTGIEAEEMQAQKMMNEINELKATLSQQNNRSTPLSAAAYHWQTNIYQPTIAKLKPLVRSDIDAAELYCQILEHKWYLSESARHDVGHSTAIDDYLQNFANK